MKKLIIIEDEYAINEAIGEYLRIKEFSVISAYNGREGFIKIIEQQPDLILCDIKMPEMTGWEVIKLCKQLEETSSIPFVFMSAVIQERDIRLASIVGANAYIIKPFNFKSLHQEIDKQLGKKLDEGGNTSSRKMMLDNLFLDGPLASEDSQQQHLINLTSIKEHFKNKIYIPNLSSLLQKESSKFATVLSKSNDNHHVSISKKNINLIIAVDDDPILNLVHKKLFEAILPSSTFFAFEDPLKALEYFQKKSNKIPDLLLLDIYMPSIDGFSLLQELEKNQITPPTLMISSSIDSEDLIKSKSFHSVIAFLSKPLKAKTVNTLFK